MKNFIDVANRETPHALDWRRFYDSVIGVHRLRHAPHRDGLQVGESEVGARLSASGFSDAVTNRLQTVFTRGLDLLKRAEETRDHARRPRGERPNRGAQ